MWIWLSLCYSSNSTTPKKLIEHFGDPLRVYEGSEEEYKLITRHPEPLMNKSLDKATQIADYVMQNDIGVLTYNDKLFPEKLKKLSNSPILLYYIGTLYDFNTTPSVGVVGTRNFSEKGARITKRISYDLARSGFTIVSGLAKGIDSFSHTAALYNKTMTTAVLGCGIDIIYPSENSNLTLRIQQDGLVLTEFAPGTAPASWNFPARNRIISALSDCVFVAECTIKSGTIITADNAFKNGTPVYMYEGLCADAQGYLATRGATAIAKADEITSAYKEKYPALKLVSELEEEKHEPDKYILRRTPLPKFRYSPNARETVKPQKTQKPQPQLYYANTVYESRANIYEVNILPERPSRKRTTPQLGELDDTEKRIIERIGRDEVLLDDLLEDSMNVTELLRILTSLEMRGYISSTAGGYYFANN